jgi:hypothetical protein
VFLLNDCLLLLFISLSTQSGNFWIHLRSMKQVICHVKVIHFLLLRARTDYTSTTLEYSELRKLAVLSNEATHTNPNLCVGNKGS